MKTFEAWLLWGTSKWLRKTPGSNFFYQQKFYFFCNLLCPKLSSYVFRKGKLVLKFFRNYHFFYFIRFSTSLKLLTQWRYDLQVSLSKIFVWNPRDHLNVLCVFSLGHAHTVCWWWPLFSKHVKTKCKLESFQITSY